MIHDTTWLGGKRARRWMRLTAPLGFLLACMLLTGLPAAASATTNPEMRGEWELAMFIEATGFHLTGTGKITQEANGSGEFAGSGFIVAGLDPATFSGTLKGSEASVTVVLAATPFIPEAVLSSATMKVGETAGLPTISGVVAVSIGGGPPSAGTLTATRIRTYQQVKEQEEKEQREKEEKEARAGIRGEWALTLVGAPQPLEGTALITEEAASNNKFASASGLFNSLPGAFSGTLEGDEASVTVTTEEIPGLAPATAFTATKLIVTNAANPTSMTGSGIFTVGSIKLPVTLTATRIKTYQQVVERNIQEAKEREAKEQQEAQLAAEQTAREHKAKELKETQEREAREAAEKAAAAKGATVTPKQSAPTLVSALFAGKALAVGNGGALSLSLRNPNASPVEGHVKLTLAKSAKTASAKHTTAGKSLTLGETSFSIAAHGSKVVKVKLSRSGRTELARRKTLHVIVTVTTQASGKPSISKTFNITLHAAKPAHSKH